MNREDEAFFNFVKVDSIIGGGTDNGQGETITDHPTAHTATQISADTNCPDSGD